jgi:hypothetical protein
MEKGGEDRGKPEHHQNNNDNDMNNLQEQGLQSMKRHKARMSPD